MKFVKQRFIALMAVPFLLMSAAVSYAQVGDYTTPDSWSQHSTINGVRFTMDGINTPNDGLLKLGLTSRYTFRMADSGDQNFYQYLRAYLNDFTLGSGTMKVGLNMRAATDIDGRPRGNHYNFAPTSLDVHLKDNDWDFRLYDAFVSLDQVVNYTKLTAGRFRINYLDEFRIDGGELWLGTEEYNAYVFYGLPVSYYRWLDTQMVGGGINTSFLDEMVQLRGQIIYFDDQSDDDDDTLYWKLRGDLLVGFDSITDANLYGEIGMIEDAFIYEVGVFGNLLLTGTTYDIWLKGQYDRNKDGVSQVVSGYDNIIGEESQYVQFGINLFQGFGEYVAAGVGFETRYNYDEWYGDRDYYRGRANIDFFNFIPNNYISLTFDYFYLPSYEDLDKNQKVFFGGRMTQNFEENVAAWLGAGVTSYKYDQHPVDLNLNNGYYTNKTKTNTMYVLYVGARWDITEAVSLQGDYTYEMSDIIADVDSDNDTIHYVELWLNIAF